MLFTGSYFTRSGPPCQYVDTAECSMESGTLRADANISLRPAGSDQLNTKVEVKNMNSIRVVGDAIAREVFGLLFESDQSPAEIVKARGVAQIGDTRELATILEEVIAAHPEAVADFRDGKKQSADFLIGQAMRASRGKANPKVLRKPLAQKLLLTRPPGSAGPEPAGG